MNSEIPSSLQPSSSIYLSLNRLFAYNESVDHYNLAALEKLPSEAVEYKAMDEGTDVYLKQLQKNCQAPTSLILKKGAQVMLLKNLSVATGLVNGTRGVVDSFVKDANVRLCVGDDS